MERGFLIFGAKDGSRTRDLNLGKVTLYQLSYFRNFIRPGLSKRWIWHFPRGECKCTYFFCPAKLFLGKFGRFLRPCFCRICPGNCRYQSFERHEI